MKVNSDVYRRISECKNPTKFRKNAIALMIIVAGVVALCDIVSGPIGRKLDQHDAAQKQKTSEMVEASPVFKQLAKEALNEY